MNDKDYLTTLFSMRWTGCLDQTIHERSIYSFLNLAGDVGGFIGIIFLIGE